MRIVTAQQHQQFLSGLAQRLWGIRAQARDENHDPELVEIENALQQFENMYSASESTISSITSGTASSLISGEGRFRDTFAGGDAPPHLARPTPSLAAGDTSSITTRSSFEHPTAQFVVETPFEAPEGFGRLVTSEAADPVVTEDTRRHIHMTGPDEDPEDSDGDGSGVIGLNQEPTVDLIPPNNTRERRCFEYPCVIQ